MLSAVGVVMSKVWHAYRLSKAEIERFRLVSSADPEDATTRSCGPIELPPEVAEGTFGPHTLKIDSWSSKLRAETYTAMKDL